MSCGHICLDDMLRDYNARSGRNTRSDSVVICDYIARPDISTVSYSLVITLLDKIETQDRTI